MSINRLYNQNKKGDNHQRNISYVAVELTNYCNYKCLICPQSQWKVSKCLGAPYDRPKGFIDFDLFCKVIDEANEIAQEVNFSFFGEPLMHPEFLKLMDYLKYRYRELRVVINTNLSFATREIFHKLIEVEISELRLSIDAATSEMYNIVRPGKYWVDLDGKSKTGERFDTICQKAEYWFSLPNHRPTRHVFTVNSKNLIELEGFVRRWLPFLGENDEILTKNILTYGGKILDEMVCHNPCNVWEKNILVVNWSGQVGPCNLDTNMDLTIGSVKESSLLDISKSLKRTEKERLSKMKKIVPCITCIDANNWSNNVFFRKGDQWSDEYLKKYLTMTR